jgi:chaperone modulatory protein CbpM
MPDNDKKAMSGVVFDETTEVTIVELCEACSIDNALIDELIDEGILEPIGGYSNERRFPYASIRRTRTVVHLQRDLGINTAGAALALELLDRIERLRVQLRRR